MQKNKRLPYIVLIGAAILLFYVKYKQRGSRPNPTHIEVNINDADAALNRNASISYSRHARCRMSCRYIDEQEVREILQKGEINVKKIQQDNRGTTYPLEGVTSDNQRVRIVFAPKGDATVEVVTCIDLDRDWPCGDCK
jgi:hypothetical protein